MSECPIIMAIVSIPTPASTARVAHVCRHDVIDTHSAPALLHAALILLATVSGSSSHSSPRAPFLMALSLWTANLGSQQLLALLAVFGGTSTTSPETTCLDLLTLTSPVLRSMSSDVATPS